MSTFFPLPVLGSQNMHSNPIWSLGHHEDVVIYVCIFIRYLKWCIYCLHALKACLHLFGIAEVDSNEFCFTSSSRTQAEEQRDPSIMELWHEINWK